MTATFTAWSAWTPEHGPPTADLLRPHATTRCLRAAAHVLAPLNIKNWANHGLVVASASGDPDGSTPIAHLPERLDAALSPAFTTSICAGSSTVASSLIETLSRLTQIDHIVTLVIEPAPAAELAVALSTSNAEQGPAWTIRTLQNAHRTASKSSPRNLCAPALDLHAALRSKAPTVPITDRLEVVIAWRDAADHPQ